VSRAVKGPVSARPISQPGSVPVLSGAFLADFGHIETGFGMGARHSDSGAKVLNYLGLISAEISERALI
jgi:hypothetical protein